MKTLLSALLLLAVMPLQAADGQPEQATEEEVIKKGRLVYHATGCVLCHTDCSSHAKRGITEG
jgi:hypothetical protein